jgi:hypothetical protein
VKVAVILSILMIASAPGLSALEFHFPRLRQAAISENSREEIMEEERISEVLDKDVSYRQLFSSVKNQDVILENMVQPGEELRYQAKWRGLPAGTIRLAAKRMGIIKGRPVFVFELSAKSNDFLNTFYPVNSQANSYVDAQNGRSYLLRRRINERNRSYKDRLEFKYENRRPDGILDPVLHFSEVEEDGREHASRPIPIPGNMQDMVSVIYYLRGMDLKEKGDTSTLLLGGRKKPAIVELEVVAEETLDLPGLGRFDALVVEPTGDGTNLSGNLVASRGAERVWLDKDTHIPLQFSAELPSPLGSVVATLIQVENCPSLHCLPDGKTTP